MKNMIILLPYLFSLYVVLNFFAANPITLSVGTFCKAFLFVIGLALLIQMLLGLFFKNRNVSAIGSFILLFFFYSYRSLESVFVVVTSTISEIAFPVIIAALIVFFFIIFIRNKKMLEKSALFLSVFSSVLLLMSFFSLMQYLWSSHQITAYDGKPPTEISTENFGELPDIYHIVLDGYARQDVLQNNYDLDNSEFIQYLDSNGFLVKNDCHTNYVSTYSSITSMLTMDYIVSNNLDNKRSSHLLTKKITQSGMGRILSEYGYNYTEVASPLPTVSSADILGIYRNQANILSYLMDRTPFYHVIDSSNILSNDRTYEYWRRQVLDDLSDLKKMPDKDSGPNYVFCHLIMCHPPFVFDSNGGAVNPKRPFSLNDCYSFINAGGTAEEYRTNYAQQLVFCNKKIIEVLDHIRNNSARPYVVIISSDHGPRLLVDEQNYHNSAFDESLPIFFAYSKPVGDDLDLSKVKSPVNLYRVLLNHYYGTNYELLPDYSYYSTWSKPLVFYNIANPD